jgi:hypothetical protein
MFFLVVSQNKMNAAQQFYSLLFCQFVFRRFFLLFGPKSSAFRQLALAVRNPEKTFLSVCLSSPYPVFLSLICVRVPSPVKTITLSVIFDVNFAASAFHPVALFSKNFYF